MSHVASLQVESASSFVESELCFISKYLVEGERGEEEEPDLRKAIHFRGQNEGDLSLNAGRRTYR